ncbi:hypothetical protein OEZ85_009715 [Tetradesmus obliquus]|uniref:Rad21/Rec8-like protein N-terminal domain-containing protein n=1 Tax=Tetradesmus obliquus TaxID=3088 RepID=A0ABY8U9V2_TETOB|nr:hypothetical protein OEZ85_009715 [Tetradesmus obliquus]
MFYSNQILARKGPLGLVWIAAHLDRQLKRQQINSTSIPASVDTLLDSEVPLALRLSGQLLLGVVRIYARKVNYLQQDCNDALVKIRVALRPADGVNLPPGSLTAPVEDITLLGPKHAAAAKASRAAGRKAAAAAAAAGETGAGDAFELDVDDIYWEQDVLLGGDGAGGFNMFELQGGTFELGLAAPSGSGPMSQDISGVFGMHSSQDYGEEYFNAEDEEAAAAWDLDELEVERLRAVASSQQQALSSGGSLGLLGLGGATPGVDGPRGKATPAGSEYDDDEQMQPPPADLPDEPPASPDVTAGARAAAAAGLTEGQTPMSTWAGGRSFAVGGDVLPPTPGGTAGGSLGGEGFAGYTGGTAGGDTPGSPGGRAGGMQGLLPPTPSMSAGLDAAAGAAAGAEGDAAEVEQQQQDADVMEVDAAEAADGEQQQGQQVKTFQRRTRQQQQEDDAVQQAAAAATEGASSDAAAAAAEEAKPKAAAKQKRGAAAALLGQKRRMVIDRVPEEPADAAAAGSSSAGKRAAAGRRQPATELPAAEIRALLADRAPLLDQTRLQSQGKRLRLEAALPLDAAGVAAASQQQQQQQQRGGLVLTGGMLEDDEIHHDEEMFHAEDQQEYSDKENSPTAAPGSAGKGAAVRGGAAAVFGSSLVSTQEGGVAWPADAEMLQEQEEEDGRLPADGGFTSRTRLVMRRLQLAAAAAAGAAGPSAAAAGMGTPATGSKRRISAVPPPGLAAAVDAGDKQAGGKAGAAGSSAAAGAVSLSFQGLTQGHGRLDSCRWFYEMLVLGNKGLVGLQQQEAYGDVLITPNLAAMARI